MNRIFRTLWSVTRQCWQAVPENAKSAGKGSATANATPTASGSAGAVASFVLSFLISSNVSAQSPPAAKTLPTGGVVAQGAATLSQTATAQAAALTVNQSSQRAVINWNTFNLGSAASVNFAQPNAQAVTLNRVSDANPSQIYGRISAPGQVFLSNPNGVYFSPTAQVDVGALTATTHSISDDDFMAGNYRFNRNGATGKVANEGKLNAALGGYIALLAPEVQNAGVVVAQAGTVAMAAGELITLNLNGVGGLANLTTTPSTIASLVENKQAVLAPDGQIILSAIALNKLQGGVIKNSGSLEANSLVNKGGKIVLEGDDITLNRNSKIEAKGPTGGGTVLVGGDWQGSGDLRQATKVTMEAGATIDASATDNGDGGKVVLWSDVHNADSQTSVAGTVLAEGHGEKTLGGQIETSGAKLKIADSARIRMGGVGASGGRWLLDPQDYTIAAAGGDITGAALGASITAGNTVEILNSAGGAAGTGAGDIKVNDAITWNNSGILKLSATGFVTGASNIAMTGGGGLIFNQAGDSTYSGVISGTGSFTKQGAGALTLSGLNTYSGGSTLSAGAVLAGSVTPLGSGAVTVASGASLDLNGKDLISTGGLTLNGTGIAILGVNQGALYNGSTAASSYAGLVTLGDDALIRTANTSGSLTLFNTGTITGAHVLSFAGGKAITVNSVLGTDLTGLIFGMSGYAATNLQAVNTYNGPITNNANSGLTFNGGGLLGGGNYSGNIVNNGRVTYFGTGTQTLSGVMSGTGAGGLRVYTGTLILAGSNTFGGAIDIINIGGSPTLVVGGAGTLNSTANITNSGGVFRYASTANQTLSGVLSGTGSFIKDTSATSTLTLSGTNNFTGTLAVNAGTLRAASDTALGGTAGSTTVGSAGTLELSNVQIGAEPLTVADGGTVHNVAGANTYAGAITLSGNATVSIDTGTSLNFTAAGAGVTVNSGKVLTLTTNGNLTFAQPLIGAGSYAKTGAGTLTTGAGSTLAVYVPPPPAPPPDPALTNPEIVAMTPTQVAAISVTQFNLLTKAQMALFTPTQLAGMTNAQILMLTPTQMSGLTASQMAAFSTAQLATFSPTMVAGLSNNQLGGFTATQVQSLSKAQLAGLSAAQIAAMNPTNAVALSAAQLGALSVSQLTGLSAAQVGALSVQQLAGLTTTQLLSLSTTQFGALSATQLAGLTPTQLGSLSNAQLGSLTTQQIQALTPAQLAVLSAAQIAILNPGQQVVFSPSQLGALSSSQLASLSPTQVGTLSTQQLGGLTPAQLGSLSDAQLSGLSLIQVLSLSVLQLNGLTPEQLVLLMPPAPPPVPVVPPSVAPPVAPPPVVASAPDIVPEPVVVAEAINTNASVVPAVVNPVASLDLTEMTTRQVAQIPVQQVRQLSPSQIESMSGIQVRTLSPQQLGVMSSTQVAAFRPPQWQVMTPTQVASFAPEQLVDLQPQQIASLTMTQLKALTPAQAKTLTPTQLSNLNVEQRAAVAGDTITIPAPVTTLAMASQTSGVLPITVLDGGSVSRATAAGVAYEQGANSITLRSIDTPPAVSNPRADLLAFNDQLTTFMVTSNVGQLVEFQGSLIGNRLMIIAPSNSARQVARAEMKLVLAAAITTLGKNQRVMLAELQGVVFDLR